MPETVFSKLLNDFNEGKWVGGTWVEGDLDGKVTQFCTAGGFAHHLFDIQYAYQLDDNLDVVGERLNKNESVRFMAKFLLDHPEVWPGPNGEKTHDGSMIYDGIPVNVIINWNDLHTEENMDNIIHTLKLVEEAWVETFNAPAQET